MTKELKAILSSLAVTVVSCAPAFAVEGMEVGKAVAKTTVRLPLFAAGTVLGVPIAILRKSAKNTSETTKELREKSENKFAKAGLSVFGAPVGVFTGTLEGMWVGTDNSWKSSKDKLFTKESVSLGDLGE